MGLAEADNGGAGAGKSEARSVLTSSSKISVEDESRGSMVMSVWVRSSVTMRARSNG